MFKLMGAYTFNKSLISSNGLKFIKLFGTGSNGGFSLIPDFSSYVLITSWKNDDYRKKFIEENNITYQNVLDNSIAENILIQFIWSGIPTTLVLDNNLEIILTINGEITAKEIFELTR